MIELIEGGFLAQTILTVLVWGSIGVLAVAQKSIPDPLLDAGFVIIGFYFHTMATNQANKARLKEMVNRTLVLSQNPDQ